MAVVGMPEHDDADEVAVLLADPWSFPIDSFVTRSSAALAGVPLVGGVASGPGGRGSTRLFVNGQTVDRGAVGVVLGGAVGADVIVSQGCRPVGPAMTVTAADGNVILELAGTPALDKLEEVVASLDPDAQALATAGLQLGIAMDEYVEDHGRGDFVVRGIAGADGSRSGLVISDLINVGTTVQLQLRDPAAAQDDLRYTLRRWQEQAGARTVDGALLFSAFDNRGVFSTARHDVAIIREMLGVDALGGFFTAGELAPTTGRNRVHGSSSVLLMFASAAAGPNTPHLGSAGRH